MWLRCLKFGNEHCIVEFFLVCPNSGRRVPKSSVAQVFGLELFNSGERFRAFWALLYMYLLIFLENLFFVIRRKTVVDRRVLPRTRLPSFKYRKFISDYMPVRHSVFGAIWYLCWCALKPISFTHSELI